MKKTNTALKMRAVIKDSTIVFNSTWALNSEIVLFGMKQARTFDPVKWSKSMGNFKEFWKEMEDIAKQFGNQIIYSK